MENALHLATEWLLRASCEVGQDYFQLPVAGLEEPQYRERVYCYELYHRWRTHWARHFPFSLAGEIDKQRHPLIRNLTKPDFLVHIPGQMMNLLIVEVKPGNRDIAEMMKDLRTLTAFRREFGVGKNYDAAYFWIYGLDSDGWNALRGYPESSLLKSSAASFTSGSG
ncbi:MAG: hypothetical protein IRY99_07320 [Isosphaeraceae bacterium]|nr:hypothetical protein [Isosphaeraceae bacterium]